MRSITRFTAAMRRWSDNDDQDKAAAMTRSPFALFDTWFAEARASEAIVPEAMSLATVGADGQPTSRMVLLKAHGEDGFIFYTNLESRKAVQIAEQPRAALLF